MTGYRAVNRRFALELADLLNPADLVWVHDYMLIPLGHELRARGAHNRLGFFLHTPFPPPAVMAVLPRAEELVEALCAYDVIGFHTADLPRRVPRLRHRDARDRQTRRPTATLSSAAGACGRLSILSGSTPTASSAPPCAPSRAPIRGGLARA